MGCKVAFVEVPFFIMLFSFTITGPASSNLQIYRTCYTLLNYNETECAQLGFEDNDITRKLEVLVEPTSNYIGLVKHIIESILGSILCMFIAPWTDRFGRKPVLVMSMIGGTVSSAMMVVYAAITTLTPWFTMATMLPALLGGGGPTFITAMHAYLTDITTEEKRGLRLGIFDGVMGLALLAGNTASPYILKSTSYVIVYLIPVVCHVIALTFIIFFIPESLKTKESKNKMAGMFDLTNLVEVAKTPFKKREKANRALLILIMVVMCMFPIMMGGFSLMNLFLRAKMHWTLEKYTLYGTAQNLLGMFGSFLVIYLLHTLLKIRDTKLVFFGSIFSVISALMVGFASQDWHIYLAAVLHIPNGGQNTLTKSFMSKLVQQDEIAKIFTITGIFSSILSPVGSTLYTLIYNKTINYNPGIFNFVTAGFLTVSLIIFLVILIVQKAYPPTPTNAAMDEKEKEANNNDAVISTIT